MKMEVNISRIEEIAGNDTEMKKMLLGMFLDTCNRVISALETAVNESTPEAQKVWKDSVHELKGAALNLGFEELGIYCNEKENADLTSHQKNESITVFKDARDGVKKINYS